MAKESSIKGKITKLKLDQDRESKNGKEYQVHALTIEDSDGDQQKFDINTKIKAADFVAKLKVGDKVTVKTGGEYGSVQAVFKDGFDVKGTSSGRFKSGNFERKPHDATGAIQGMVLKAAIDIAISDYKLDMVDSNKLQDRAVEAAKLILLAKIKIDKLVVQALKPKDDEDDSDDEESNKSSKKASQEDDDDSDEAGDEEESPKKNKKKSSPY